MSIGIIDVGIGNIGSLRGALYSQGWDTKTIAKISDMANVSHLFLPGVGSFSIAMQRLRDSGLIDAIIKHGNQGRPIMGICLGMQLLAEQGEEGGRSSGLGLISGEIIRFDISPELHLPHVGWNVLQQHKKHPLLNGIRPDVDFYFVHSYFFNASCKVDVVGTTDYGICFPSFVAKGSVVGVQFHPEKSQRNGLRLLDNFCLWDGSC